MTLYFTDKQVPEMSVLKFSQRRIVRRGAFRLFCSDQPQAWWQVRVGNGITVLLALSIAWSVSDRFWIQMLAGVGIVSVIQLFFQSFLTERLRPYIQRYITENSDEILRAS